MAAFVRQEITPGGWGYRALVTPGEPVPDGVHQDRTIALSSTDITKIDGLWSTSYDQTFTVGHASRRVMASKLSQPRKAVFTIVSGDTTGLEARLVKRFFTYDGPILYYDSERSVSSLTLYVTAIDSTMYDGSVVIQVSADTMFSDEITQLFTLVGEADLPAGASKTITATPEIISGVEQTVRVTLAAPSGDDTPISFSGAEIVMQKLNGNIVLAEEHYKPATNGDTRLPFKGYTWSVDSLAETVAGSGVLIPSAETLFFSYGDADAGYGLSVTAKAPSSDSVRLTVQLVAEAPRGTIGEE